MAKPIQYCKVKYSKKKKKTNQEMARVNIDILRISELKWTGWGEFNSDGHYIYYVDSNPLEKMK